MGIALNAIGIHLTVLAIGLVLRTVAISISLFTLGEHFRKGLRGYYFDNIGRRYLKKLENSSMNRKQFGVLVLIAKILIKDQTLIIRWMGNLCPDCRMKKLKSETYFNQSVQCKIREGQNIKNQRPLSDFYKLRFYTLCWLDFLKNRFHSLITSSHISVFSQTLTPNLR